MGRPQVFAAASLAPVLEGIAEEAEVSVAVHAAASSTLARQIGQGAPAELFVSADPRWLDELEGMGVLREGSRVPVCGNGLVFVSPAGSDPEPLALGDGFADGFVGRLAIGDPAHVPLGRYGEAALRSLGLWDAVAARLAPCADARAALRAVRSGQCVLGLVYASDRRAFADDLVVRAVVPAEHQPTIVYEAALLRDAGPAAVALHGALQTATAKARLAAAGFVVDR